MIKTSCHYQLKHLSYGIGTIAGDRALNKCSTVTKLIDNRSKIGIYICESIGLRSAIVCLLAMLEVLLLYIRSTSKVSRVV